jgi:hypothetical protein
MSVLKLGRRRKPRRDPEQGTVVQKQSTQAVPARGWFGPGAGRSVRVQAALEYRASTMQACGLWPFAAGTGNPMIGVPLGRSLINDGTVCCDPISWFQQANLIHNPSAFYLGKPGLGKSSLLRHQSLGLAGFGVLSMFLGDTKGEHVDLIEAQGGDVFRLGPGRDYINVLDISAARDAEQRLSAAGFVTQGREIRADGERRRLVLVEALISLSRNGGAVGERETDIIGESLRLLDERSSDAPVLADLMAVIEERPDALAKIAMDRGDESRYLDVTDGLMMSLRSLTGSGRLGQLFSRPSTVKLSQDRSCVFDLSGLARGDDALLAACLLVCWAIGFHQVTIGQVLAECHLEPLRHRFVVADELWVALRAGEGMVRRFDEATRLNRQWGVGVAYCTHAMSDLELPSAADTAMARGFVERVGMVVCAGLPPREVQKLREIVAVSEAEETRLTSWVDPPGWNDAGEDRSPPGRGNFLIKVGGRPGIPVHVELTDVEKTLNDTNKLWHHRSQLQFSTDPESADV